MKKTSSAPQHITKCVYATSISYTGFKFSERYKQCKFNGVSFGGALLSGTFTECDFKRSDFWDCTINGAIFVNCDFTGSRFFNSSLRLSKFIGCTFKGVTMKSNVGVSTCTFDLTCKYVISMETDLSIKLLGKKGVYSLIPKSLTQGTTVDVGEDKVSVESMTDKQPKLLLEKNSLVNPTLLPSVKYYRSKCSKILPSQKEKEKKSNLHDWDEDDYYNNLGQHFTMGMMSGGSYYHQRENIHEYGYAKNAVLLCSDIEEFDQCPHRMS